MKFFLLLSFLFFASNLPAVIWSTTQMSIAVSGVNGAVSSGMSTLIQKQEEINQFYEENIKTEIDYQVVQNQKIKILDKAILLELKKSNFLLNLEKGIRKECVK